MTTLRNRLQPNPQQSEFVRKHYLGSAGEQQFAAANMFGLTPEQLIDQVLASPNYEYYTLLCEANDDRVMLAAALEIARAYPGMRSRHPSGTCFISFSSLATDTHDTLSIHSCP